MVYIALLRGINVGGHVVKMERLRELFTELGFADIRTYIQSGNVFFDTEQTDRIALTAMIEKHLYQALGYDVPVLIRTIPELERILALDPFKDRVITPEMRLCVTFTANPIAKEHDLPLLSPKRDMEIVLTTDREAFVIWHIIDGRIPSASGFLEKTLGNRTTTRFFHTAAKILQAAKK